MSRSDALPVESQLHAYARPQDFMDCFSVAFSNEWAKAEATMPEIAALATSVEVPGAQSLMQLRDLIVKPLGLKTADEMDEEGGSSQNGAPQIGDRIGFFKIYGISDNEIILGEDDRHQDFRVSVLRVPEVPSRLYLATCCQRHNLLGHLYLATILPFHKMIVKGMLDGVAKKLSAAGDAPVTAA